MKATTTTDIIQDARKRARREAHIMFKAGRIDRREYDRILTINATGAPIKPTKEIDDPFDGINI